MDHLPIFVDLHARPCLVVGGGQVAARKVSLLRRAGALVTVVAPTAIPSLVTRHESGDIRLRLQAFDTSMLSGNRLVIAASGDPQLNAAVASAADRGGILCNVVDNNAASGFIVPAIVDRHPVTVAIGTAGRAPVLAQTLKGRIESVLPARIGMLADKAGRWRAIVARRFPAARDRRYFWQRFFDGPIAAHLLAGRNREAEHAMRRELIDGKPLPRHGEASIVGAGPGDPSLVTLRAQQLISRADVILHDRLVSADVLDMARKEAELIPVGKAAGAELMSQDAINALLVDKVRAGYRVCRLKGGDPFVFGRGGEEALALAAAGLSFDIVPGIPAALGCAAYAGIPLTLRGVSAGITLATARLDGGQPPDWPGLARPGKTLALYMSVGSLDETGAQLIAHGLDAATPAALVENGTTGWQRVLWSDLGSLAADARQRGIEAPAMLFVGEAVSRGRALQWYSPAPAFGGRPFAPLDVKAGCARSA